MTPCHHFQIRVITSYYVFRLNTNLKMMTYRVMETSFDIAIADVYS